MSASVACEPEVPKKKKKPLTLSEAAIHGTEEVNIRVMEDGAKFLSMSVGCDYQPEKVSSTAITSHQEKLPEE